MELRDYFRAIFGVERVGVWLVAGLAVAVTVTVVSATGGGLIDAPTASFDGTYDETTNTVTLTHAGGDQLSPTQVTLVVTNASGTQSANLTLGNTDGQPLEQGASVGIDDPTVDSDGDGNYFDADRTVGFALTAGATIEIRWTGRPVGAAETRTVTLDTYEIGSS